MGQATTATKEEDDDESRFSDGQVIVASSQSVSDESEISEELQEPEEGGWFLIYNFIAFKSAF